jgi:hypothetical protein
MSDLALFIFFAFLIDGCFWATWAIVRLVRGNRDACRMVYVYRWNADEGCYEKVFKLTDRRQK